jgi:hypothetical protein
MLVPHIREYPHKEFVQAKPDDSRPCKYYELRVPTRNSSLTKYPRNAQEIVGRKSKQKGDRRGVKIVDLEHRSEQDKGAKIDNERYSSDNGVAKQLADKTVILGKQARLDDF